LVVGVMMVMVMVVIRHRVASVTDDAPADRLAFAEEMASKPHGGALG
jgi:hypothetical protein